MATERHQLGNQGEQIAQRYLMDKGYTIRDIQWRCKVGEIDIVAYYHDTLIFVEVKTCQGKKPEFAFANLTPKKQQRFIAAAYEYLAAHNIEDVRWQIDAIGIAISANSPPIIEHVEDAFDW